uniref:Uncharacterized protein n=1 Tax=Meloidogyne enterolobii TaxID=390850 RepID=A0A6V7VQQ2_MELEN|nr:unnamed protein product [Meloidogyne enterolobii]
MFVLSLGKWFGHFAVKRREEAANREKQALLEKEENLNKNNQQFSPVNFQFNSRKVLKENFEKEIEEEENVEDESEYEEVTDNEEEEEEEEVTDEESSISSAFAEFKIGGNGSILNENGMNGEDTDDDEYETSVEEIIQLRVEKYPVKSPIEEANNNNKNISSTSNSPLLDHTQPQAVGATVKAVIRTILRSGTELARIKLNNLAEFRKNEENKIIEELKPVNSSVLLSPMESEEEFSEEEWEEEEEIKEDEESLNKVNEISKMAINKQIDEDSISIYSDALEGPPDLITIISVKNEEKKEIIEINSILEDNKKDYSSPLPILRREIKMPVERSLEVKLRSGSVKEEKNGKEIKEEVDDEEEMMVEKEEEWKKEKSFEEKERRKNLEENEGRKLEEEEEEEKIKLEDKEMIVENGWIEGRKEKEFKSEEDEEEEETIIVECTEKEDKITSSGGEICSMANSETTDDEEFEYEYITDEEGEIIQVEEGNLKGEKLEEKSKEKEEVMEEEFEEEEYEEEEEEEEDWDTRSEISQVEKEIERMRRVSVASSISRSPGYRNSEIGVSLNSSQKQCEVTENDDNSREKTPIALGQERQSEYNIMAHELVKNVQWPSVQRRTALDESRASSSSLLQNSFQSSKDQEETTESSQLNSKTNKNTPKIPTTTKILLPPLHPSTSKNSPSFTFDSPLNKEDCQNNISKKEIKEDLVIKSPMMDEAAFTRLTSPLSKEINLDVVFK